ncbi:MAG: hypothetical protein ABH827_01995 [bacterium]
MRVFRVCAFVFIFTQSCVFCVNQKVEINQAAFAENFIKHYEFSPEGRYVHEYHPFILRKTAQSFDQLEGELQANGYKLSGRCVILGYEENAVPPYYTNYKEAKINDEASLKSNAGWSLKLHNRFGFMTGFLFKDIIQDSVFQHINAASIFLFDDRASIFQEHAFDEALPLIIKAQARVMPIVKKGDANLVFGWLIRFWQALYAGGFKVGNKQVAGTQDILFSIENARHVLKSGLPITKFAIGPDITYPIEIFGKQERGATRNAQTFVKSFVKTLEPVNAEPTVYIFCSFVDGVGKSTMLGNIKNWMVHGDNIDQFDHVDNSSSQVADMFQFKDNVFIVDMPAQVSHFTYKPDGLVYADAQTEFGAQFIEELRAHVRSNHVQYEREYQELILRVSGIIARAGYFAPEINDIDNPKTMFVRNVLLLKKKQENYWVPFEYDGKPYLFNKANFLAIRMLMPLAQVKSEGLKNIESEQMLFCNGIRFPLAYRLFLDDLMSKLREKQAKNIVFVDFLGMYPRSSRENVRINYLLQQFALLDSRFDVNKSIYKNFSSGGELLNYLLDDRKVARILDAFKLEALVRVGLYEFIVGRDQGDLTGITVEALTNILREKLQKMPDSFMSYVHACASDKVVHERNHFKDLYGLSKHFVNIQLFDFSCMCNFCYLLQHFFKTSIQNEQLEFMWEDPGVISASLLNSGQGVGKNVSPFVQTTGGVTVRQCFTFLPECRDEVYLTPFLRMLRASWYATLANLIYSTEKDGNKIEINRQIYPAPPLFVVQPEGAHTVQVFQRIFEPFKSGKVPVSLVQTSAMFHLAGRANYGVLGNQIYRLNWESTDTNNGVFSFACNFIDRKTKRNADPDTLNVISRYVKKHQSEHDVGTVITSSDLYEKLKQSVYWKMEQKKILKKATKHGIIQLDSNGFFCFDKTKKNAKSGSSGTAGSSGTVSSGQNTGSVQSGASQVSGQESGLDSGGQRKKRKRYIFLGRQEQKAGIRCWVRLIATLEMIAKDPDSNIAVRYGNKKDFKAAVLLLEKMTLPLYFGITYKENLFDDYDAVEPYPSWAHWEEE